MNNKIKEIINEILDLEDFNLYLYYKYINEYSKQTMIQVFLYILEKYKDDNQIFNKFFDAFFSIELENLKITKNTYIILSKKYGEDRVNDYFLNLLEIYNDSDEIKTKYEYIYSQINCEKDAYFHDDMIRDYITSLPKKLLTVEEEKNCFYTLERCRQTIEIASFDDIDNLSFYNIDKVICSISSLEQLRMLNKIKVILVKEDKEKINYYYPLLKEHFKHNKILIVENSDVYPTDYFEEQLCEIIEFINTRQLIIDCNLKLVVSIAKKFHAYNLHLMDFIQEGNLGLMKAIKKFDVHMGNKLSTYATWWIKQFISRAISEQANNVRIPIHLDDKIKKINRVIMRFEVKYGYTPSDEEIADCLKISVEEVIFAKNSLRTSSTVSLNIGVGDDDDATLEEFIAADNSDSFDIAANNELREIFIKVFDTLTEKEKFVLMQRFGLEDNIEKTLDEVGKILGVTRERIRQIENKAIRKLRHTSRSKYFDGYR